MKKTIIIILVLILVTQLVSGTYYSNKKYCKERNDYEKFIAPCPHDHRDNNNYLLIKSYIMNESISYCVDGNLIQECNYTLLPWFHPKVTGNGRNIQQVQVMQMQEITGVPEFGPFGLFMVISLGITGMIWQRKHK